MKIRARVGAAFIAALMIVSVSAGCTKGENIGETNTLKNITKSEENQENVVYLAVSYDTDSGDYGYINETGNFEIEPKFQFAMEFSKNGLAPVEDNNALWGFIDTSGEYVIEPQYHGARSFSNGLAAVAIGGEKNYGSSGFIHCVWGYIDEKGNWIVEPGEPSYYEANQFSSFGLATVSLGSSGGSYKFIDKKGNIVCNGNSYRDVTSFSKNGLAGVQRHNDSLWGFIDETGEYVIEEQFSRVGPFSDNGYALVKDANNEHNGIIDSTGNWLITIQDNLNMEWNHGSKVDEKTNMFSDNGLALCYTGTDYSKRLYGYINESGEVVIEPQFPFACTFADNGLAHVHITSGINADDFWIKDGYIDQSGNYVIKPILGSSYNFYRTN